MAHNHGSAGQTHRRSLIFVFILTASYTAVEFIGAFITGSLALLADAAHMLTDVGGLGLSLLGIWFASRPASPRRSYGNYRSEILAAALNGLVLLGVGAYIIYEAWHRFSEPPEIASGLMIVVAAVGLAVNVTGALLLRRGAGESLNVQGAYLEVMADLLGSVAAIAAGLIMLMTGWWLADPLFSLLIGLLIVPRTVQLLRGAVSILMEATPNEIDVAAVAQAIRSDPDVIDLHDLHIWSLTSGMPVLTAHVRVPPSADSDAVLGRLADQLEILFDIHHTTIQVERSQMTEESVHLAPPSR